MRKVFALAVVPLALQWSVVDRLQGPASVQDPPRAQSPVVSASVPGCPRNPAWRLDGDPVQTQRVGRCEHRLPVTPGEHELEARAGARTSSARLQVREHLVVSIGDSVASGEGNPHGPPGRAWFDRRCHNSMRAGHAQAALAFERGDPTSEVTFVSLACSGASLEVGLRRPYRGIDPDRRGPLRPQLDRLDELAPGREVGAVLVSAGANDANFGALVVFCASVTDCPNKRFDPDKPRREARDPDAPTAAEVVAESLRRLPASYDYMATRLRARVEPRRVVVVEYFDALGAADGDTCDSLLAGRVRRGEAEWMRRNFLAPLNAQIHAAAARHGWRVVGGVADAFRRHGVCAGRGASWVHGPLSAVGELTPLGIFHPNVAGHRATAALIAPVLSQALETEPGAVIAELPAEDEGGLGGILLAGLVGLLLGGLLVAVGRGPARRAWRGVGPAVRGVLRPPTLWALLAAAAGALAFALERSSFRLVPAVAAIVAALAYFVTAWRTRTRYAREAEGQPQRPRWRRAATFLGVLLLGILALLGAFIGTAVWLGRALEDDIAPVSTGAMNLGVAIGLIVFAAFCGWVAYCAQCIFFKAQRSRRRRVIWSGVVAVLGAVVLIPALNARTIPNERSGPELARQALRGQYDVLLVVHPADPLGQRLGRTALRYVREGRPAALFPAPASSVGYDVAYGVAVPQRDSRDGSLWRLVEPPTTDREEVARALADLVRRPPPRPPRAHAYGRVLVDALDSTRVRWRPDAQRGVALVLDELPSRAALDRGVPSASQDEEAEPTPRLPRDAPAGELCGRLLTRREAPVMADVASRPVAWGDVLALHCARWAQHLQWERDRRLAHIRRPPGAVALHVVTRDRRAARLRTWSSWARSLDGRLLPAGAPREVLRVARDAHTGIPVGGLAELVETYRPHLFFDSRERFYPVDVDELLREGGHHTCDRGNFGRDNCEPLDDHTDLTGALDEYIDFAGGARHGRDLWGRDGVPSRMYVHVREQGGKLYLGYWWYLLFNSSPYRPELNCLPGVTWKAATCHDHEGDWEGVTVVLDVADPNLLPDPHIQRNVQPEAAIYDAHGRSVRWAWPNLQLVGDQLAGDATHPAVYVAAGSHAAYPQACDDDPCDQRLANEGGIPEGAFDGKTPWPYNRADRCAPHQVGRDGAWIGGCLIPLPSTRDGRLGMMWNAFPGAWGKAVCIRFAKICSQVDGPRSPSRQARFTKPWRFDHGPVEKLSVE